MFRILGAALALFVATTRLHADPIPIRTFLTPPGYSQPRISPDGKKLALLVHNDNREQVVLLDLATMQPEQVGLVELGGILDNCWWKGNDTLLLHLTNDQGRGFFRSLNVRTKAANSLSSMNNSYSGLINPLPDDANNVLIFTIENGNELHRMDVHAGKMTPVEKGQHDVIKWLTNTRGEPVAILGLNKKKEWFLLFHKSANSDWSRLPLGSSEQPDFYPVAVHQDQHRLIGWDYASDNTTRAMVLDPATGSKETLFQVKDVDLDSYVGWSDDVTRVIGIDYETDFPQRYYLDPASAALLAKIAAALPAGRVNGIVSESQDGSVLVVHSRSDRTMGEYYLLNQKTMKLTPLGPCQGNLPESAMSPTRAFHYTSRDGLQLSGRIVLPTTSPSTKPPLILMVGPFLNGPRTRYQFNSEEQLLASRGYAVARINCRGVPGFGRQLLQAGDQQLFSGMPNDLEDGVRWLIDQGWVAPRVAVFGHSSGGLLALQLAARPEPFAAWINFRGLMRPMQLDYRGLVFSADREDEVKQALGGRRAAWNFRESAAQSVESLHVRVPAFHVYAPVDYNMPTYDNTNMDTAEGYAKRSQQPYVSVLLHDWRYNQKHYNDNSQQADLEQRIETYAGLLDFLSKYLPVTAPAAGR